MSKNGQNIRTIHDAIDVKISRVTAEIQAEKRKREAEITQEVKDKLGMTRIIQDYKAITGREPYDNRYDDDSQMGIAMATARKELTKYDEKLRKITMAAEDAHIEVVTGEYGQALANLDKALKAIE